MTDPVGKPTRADLEAAGFEAVQRLYAEAVDDAQERGEVCARLLLGLYNGNRFPFDLTDLRTLPPPLFDDAMLAIRMDARLTRQEVHHYFSDGSRKFEDLVSAYGLIDIQRLREGHDGLPRPPALKGTLCEGDYVSATLVTCGDAPGYRDILMTFDCEVVGEQRQAVGTVRLELKLRPVDAVSLLHHIQRVNVFAWRRPDRGPLDQRPDETRPAWLDLPPTSQLP